MFEKKSTEEHRKKISNSSKGHKKPKGFGDKISKVFKGKKKSYYSPLKKLYEFNIKTRCLNTLNEKEIKEKYNIENYIVLKKMVNNCDFFEENILILESQEAIEKLTTTKNVART